MVLEEYHSDILGELKAIVNGDSPLFQLLKYHLGWTDEDGAVVPGGHPGKLLRPTFCLMSCEAAGGDWRQAIPAAAAIELIHNFSLIHDDIEDCSVLRRGRRTLWAIWGTPLAINAGDAMHTLAGMEMLRLSQSGLPPKRIVDAMTMFNEASLALCEGQHLDLTYEKRLDITSDDYLAMISGKTAALFECSFGIGALLGTGRQSVIRKFRDCGRSLGLAFQIKDDILGIWGGEETGKSVESDLQEKKKTLPVVYALRKAKGSDLDTLTGFYRNPKPSRRDIAGARKALEHAGAREYAETTAGAYLKQAFEALDASGLPPKALEDLRAAARMVVEREF